MTTADTDVAPETAAVAAPAAKTNLSQLLPLGLCRVSGGCPGDVVVLIARC